MSGCGKCDDGWIEIDDMPQPCRTCNRGIQQRFEWANQFDGYYPEWLRTEKPNARRDAVDKLYQQAKEDLRKIGEQPAPAGPVDRYLSVLAEAMGLGDWVLVIHDEPADEGTVAEIGCTLGQKHAFVYLCENWMDLDPVTQRDTLVHELVHAHLSLVRHMADALFDTVKGGATAKAAFHLTEEYATESIAQAWAPYLPLPEAAKPKRKRGKK
jgi:hypothetical protein